MPKRQFLFSAVFGFRNLTQEILSELDETKSHGLIFHGAFQNTEGETERGQGGPTTPGGTARRGRAGLWGGPLGRLPTLPLRLFILTVAKTLVPRATIREKFQRRRRSQSHIGGFKRSPPAPFRRGESSPEDSTSQCPPPD